VQALTALRDAGIICSRDPLNAAGHTRPGLSRRDVRSRTIRTPGIAPFPVTDGDRHDLEVPTALTSGGVLRAARFQFDIPHVVHAYRALVRDAEALGRALSRHVECESMSCPSAGCEEWLGCGLNWNAVCNGYCSPVTQ
jgi:hypothetical protein